MSCPAPQFAGVGAEDDTVSPHSAEMKLNRHLDALEG